MQCSVIYIEQTLVCQTQIDDEKDPVVGLPATHQDKVCLHSDTLCIDQRDLFYQTFFGIFVIENNRV